MSSKPVKYFDYNATHPPFPEILDKNLKNYFQFYFNPSGASRFSLDRQSAIEDVRTFLSNLTNKPKKSFVFCSTGTEANQLMLGYVFNGKQSKNACYVSPFEHSSIYGALDTLKIEYKILKCNREGYIDLDFLNSQMNSNPLPVIVLLAGNETGVVQPYKEISEICRNREVLFLSDLMQAFCKIPIDFSFFDSFTFSGHKIGGGMGGAVVCLPLEIKSEYKTFKGGNQENNFRAGTENTPSILSIKDASVLQLSTLEEKNLRLQKYKSSIENNLLKIGGTIIAEKSNRLPSTTFVILPSEDIDFILMGLEEKDIIVSTGSSCKSRAREASPSLLSMGYSREEALRAIRISTGYFTTLDEVEYLNFELTKLLINFR